MADSKRKTANLFDKTQPTTLTNKYLLNNGEESSFASGWAVSAYIPVSGDYVTLSGVGGNLPSICAYDSNKQFVRGINYGNNNRTTIYISDCSFVRFSYVPTVQGDNAMLNEGSTALPYEPYGWVHSLRKLGTSTDTLTTLPADVYADGTNATVGLVGDMVQNGTPTPQNPIQPSECGERTAQLIAYPYFTEDSTIVGVTWTTSSNGAITATGTTSGGMNFYLFKNTPLKAGTYTISVSGSIRGCALRLYNYTDGEYIISNITSSQTFTIDNDIPNTGLYFNQGNTNIAVNVNCTVMLNSGSSPLPYEPYGQYKIPISSANTTTPVYLSEMESTRQIRELVLTGEETGWNTSSGLKTYYIDVTPSSSHVEANITVCSHYESQVNVSTMGEVSNKKCCFSTSVSRLYFKDTDVVDLTTWTTYLQQQYANGTPVTVWYVLATPTTGIVNEPLRKIGDYADTVSGITIPTIAGKDSFDVLTTLKPSEVELTYTGWHDASVKEWDGSQWQ